ncbi:MAG: FG-GAP-like repeat-containing protein, partial [Bacteroidota bacterium]
VYKNMNGKFEKMNQQFIPLMNSDGAWGDLDNDLFMDFIVSGETYDGYPVCIIYKNQSGKYFKEVTVSIRALKGCTIDLGDYDGDDDLDILMTGESLERSYTNVYENKLGLNFENIMAGLPGVADGNALWGDYDKDGDLDILLSGLTICYDFIGDIYINTLDPPKKEVITSIFINAPLPVVNSGPYYYYVFSSCYCDPTGGDNNAYHMYVSNVHLQTKKYQLNYKFNDLLVKQVPNWGDTDRGYRTSNGFETKMEADVSRKQVVESYRSTNFTIHELNW